MLQNITIQNITTEDIPELIELALNTPELHVDEEPEYYSKETLESFITSPHDIYLAAKINGEIAGFTLTSVNPYLKEAYMVDMSVKPEFRRQGIATLLLQETFKRLEEKDCVWAWALVQEKNTRMQQILAKKGFTKGKLFYFFYKNKPF